MQENEQINVRTKDEIYCVWCGRPIVGKRVDTEDDYGYTQSYHKHCYRSLVESWRS